MIGNMYKKLNLFFYIISMSLSPYYQEVIRVGIKFNLTSILIKKIYEYNISNYPIHTIVSIKNQYNIILNLQYCSSRNNFHIDNNSYCEDCDECYIKYHERCIHCNECTKYENHLYCDICGECYNQYDNHTDHHHDDLLP
jgi:hypothetical protein